MQPARREMTVWRQPIFIFITKSSFTSQYFLPRIKKSKRIAMINHNVGKRLGGKTQHVETHRTKQSFSYFSFSPSQYIDVFSRRRRRGWGMFCFYVTSVNINYFSLFLLSLAPSLRAAFFHALFPKLSCARRARRVRVSSGIQLTGQKHTHTHDSESNIMEKQRLPKEGGKIRL